MTKITYVEALAAVIPTVEDKAVREKLEALKASLEKKSSSKGTRKPTATQKANESHKEVILASMEEGRRYTITEMCKEFPFTEELSNQRVSALLTQLRKSDKVVRTVEKKVAFYSIKEESDEVEEVEE